MGHYVSEVDRLFQRVNYRTKTSGELRAAMTEKVGLLRTSMEEREARMRQIRDEYSLDAERLAVLVMRYQEGKNSVSYQNQGPGTSGGLVPAGVIANLVREREMIDSEHDQIAKLELILRNMRDDELYHDPRTGEVKTRPALHQLTDQELEYLGF